MELDLGGRQVRTTFLDDTPLRDRRDLALPLMPLAWRTIRGGPYDLVVSSSHACAKGFGPGRNALHLSYVHTPMRYAWLPELDGRGQAPWMQPARAMMKRWDRRSTRWVDDIAANSSLVVERIARFWGRQARLIPPPVDVAWYSEGSLVPDDQRHGAVAISRWVPYKRLDLAIRAAHAANVPLTVSGHGPQAEELRNLAGSLGADVTFEEHPSRERLRELYSQAQVVIFPPIDDFGLVPVEAQAAGTPVIGVSQGGARDTIVHGTTGLLVDGQSVDVLAEALRQATARTWDAQACRTNAASFRRERFIEEVRAWADEALADQRG